MWGGGHPTVTSCVIINQCKDLHFSLAVQAFKGLILLHSVEKRGELGQWREEERVSEQG